MKSSTTTATSTDQPKPAFGIRLELQLLTA